MKKENECEERCIECDQKEVMSDAERYRLAQARVMLLKAGYVELPDGNFIKPDLAPKDGKKQK